MDGMMNLDMIGALQKIIKPQDDDGDSDSDNDMKPTQAIHKMGPGDIGPKRSSAPAKPAAAPKKASKDIWDEDEVNELAEYEDIHDPRPSPDYDIVYSQDLSTETLMGMDNKTPATASCENMTVKIKLPATKGSDIKLDVKDKFLDCRTPKYKLGLYLPHPVHAKSGKAKWISDLFVLEVTLKMNRQYDFMNY